MVGTFVFERQNSFVVFERFTRFILKRDKSACILVFLRTARDLFLYTRIPSVWREITPNLRGIRDDFATLFLQNLLIVAPTRDK